VANAVCRWVTECFVTADPLVVSLDRTG
jgi:hypothetical protein